MDNEYDVHNPMTVKAGGGGSDLLPSADGSYTPLTLFAAGEQGVWYDPSDLSTLFQDAAGTISVTGPNQRVGLMKDKSGRGNHARQPTAASKPFLRNSGALWYLEFDGVDDFLTTASISFTAEDEMTVFAGLRKLSDAATGVFVELSVNTNANDGSFLVSAPNSAASTSITFASKGSAAIVSAMDSTITAPATVVMTGQSDISAPVASLRINGLLKQSVATSQGTGNYGNYPLYLGRRGGTTLPFAGYLYGLAVRGASTDAADITSAETYLAAKSGVTL